MHAAVIDHNTTPTYTSLSILRVLKQRSHHAYYLPIDKLSCIITNNGVEVRFQDKALKIIDCFFLRAIGNILNSERFEYRINLLKSLESMKKVIINPVTGYLNARNKFSCLSLLASKNINVPETLITENEFIAYEFIKKMGKCVVKPMMGSRGIGSFLVEDADIAFRRLQELREKGYALYIQRYVNKPGRDLRVFVVGDEVIGGMARESDNWKTNVYQGAKGRLIEISGELERLAVKVNKELGLLYSGIDIAEENGRYYILEVNASPIWVEFQKVTQINPAEKIIDLAEKIIKNNG
jgi:ribosomal protein S6--L-glutamate ligase